MKSKKLFLLAPMVFLLVLFGWAGGVWAGVAQVAAGDFYTVVLKTDGSLWAWGENEHGQLGDGTTTNRTSPVQVGIENDWQTVAAGYYHALAIKTDGTLWAWGSNWCGLHGDGTTTDKNSPVQIGTENDWQTVAAGPFHTVAVKTDGSLWAWGGDWSGQIGTENDWQTVAAGGGHTFALKTDGSLWAWGGNGHGQLGDGTTIYRNIPVQIDTENNWQDVAAGDIHSVAVKTDGSLWAWGENGEGWQGWEDSDWDGWEGQLGDGTTINRNSPVQIGTENDWQVVDAGPHHTIAVKTDGSLWAWGANWRGQLGDGTTVRKKSPVQIGTENDWQNVAVGYDHTVALKTDGSLWTWGDNLSGQLGDGTTTNKNIPVQIEIEANSYTVTPSAGTGGSISPDSPQTVSEGATTSFTVLAGSGYKIEKVEGCGGTLSGNTYTTAPVTEDCSVTASFMPHPSRNGMTWGINKYIAELDITRVHCYGQVGPNRGPCDPYQGDTSCSAALPLLCVKVDGTPRPAYALATCSSCAMPDEYYNGWAEGSIGLTAPAQGNAFATLADADAYCAAQLGEGYKVAEHHTGRYVMGMDENNFYGSTWPANTSAGGWGLYGPGQLVDKSRFWVDINDQDANCWGRSATTATSLSVNSSGASGVAITGSPSAYSGATNYSKTGIPSGTVITLTAPAASGSKSFIQWGGCDSTDTAARTCTVTMSANKTVTVSYATQSYIVTPSAGVNGSISPNSPQSVEHGNTASFEVTPSTGYVIDKVEGCDGSLNGSTYTTGAITADCAVTATFVSSTTYTVTPRAGRHGSLSPSAPQQVRQGTTASFTVTPDAEYAIRYVSGCGGSLSGNVYTTGPITRNCSVTASFKRLPKHLVIPSAGRHGSISPRRPQRVLHGMTTSFTVTPRPGYAVRRVYGCGGSLSGDIYTTGAITRSCWVRAAFTKEDDAPMMSR